MLELNESSQRPVKLLPADVIHRIAAGEVVDRPASVLKELIDNSLDAGAQKLKIILVEAGLTRIEVEDDGFGLSREDLDVCAQRHATSKIQNLADLEAIASFGFRGEALSAIASVSALRIESYREGSGAWHLEIKGGERLFLRPGTRTRGTRVCVNDIFFNVPARRKFLKSLGAEWNECQEVLIALALAHPDKEFSWHFVDAHGELRKQVLLEPSSLPKRMADLALPKGEILHIQHEPSTPGLKYIEIAFMKPPVSSAYQKTVRLSVNGRPVLDKRLPYVLREACAGLMEIGRYPLAQINVQVDPSLIDVNIHPQKKEIRWPHDFSIASLIYALLRPSFEPQIKSADSAATEEPQAELNFAPEIFQTRSPTSPSIAGSTWPGFSSAPSASEGSAAGEILAQSIAAFTPSLPATPKTQGVAFAFSSLRVVGEIGAAWIVGESSRGLVLIDQHAAHERVQYEKIFKSRVLLRSKPLLLPLQLDLPVELRGAERSFLDVLEDLGFEYSLPEGYVLSELRSIDLVAIPEADRKLDWKKLFEEIFEDLSRGEAIDALVPRIKSSLAASLACHSSVRRGQRLENESIAELLKQLDEVEWGGLCPHGRPVWTEISHEHIEKIFHR